MCVCGGGVMSVFSENNTSFILSLKLITMMLMRLCRFTGWYVSLFAKDRFSRNVPSSRYQGCSK